MKKSLMAGILVIIFVGLGVSGYFITNRESKRQNVTPPKVSIALVTFPGFGPLYVAKEKGFFEGIDVELKRIESIGDIRAAMRSGDVNMYAATYDIFQSTKGVAPSGTGF